MKYYAMAFEVTETQQNGNERTLFKTVYAPLNDQEMKKRVDDAIKLLKSKGYYNIECKDESIREILIVGK